MSSFPTSSEPRITIANLYYLLCYATGHLEEMDAVDVESMPSAELADLFAEVLCRGIGRLLRRGFSRDYVERKDEGRTIRGKLDFASSTSRLLLQNGLVSVTTSDLSLDTLPNQLLVSTLAYLRRMTFLSPASVELVGATITTMRDVAQIRLTRSAFGLVQLHAGNRLYKFLLDVCQLIFETLMVAPDGQDCTFRSFVRDDVKMRRIWEQFLRNFYRHNLSRYAEGPRSFPWKATPRHFLPSLNTDITLVDDERLIILDAKYSASPLEGSRYEVRKLSPGYLNQIFAYAMNIPIERPAVHACLVFPLADVELKQRFEMKPNLTLWALTVDLSKPWQEVRAQLIGIIRHMEDGGRSLVEPEQREPPGSTPIGGSSL